MRNATFIEAVYRRELAAVMREMGIGISDHAPFDVLLTRLHQHAAIRRMPRRGFPFYEHRTMLEVMQGKERP